MKTSFNPSVSAALSNIRETLAYQQRVTFVYHVWAEFNNLSMEGFKFPQIPEIRIPRMSLIPVVAIQQSHMDSMLDRSTNRYVPVEKKYQREIEASVSDLMSKFARYGMVQIPALNSSIDEIERPVKIYDIVTRGIDQNTLLEVLPEYYGQDTPVSYQFVLQRKLIEKPASEYLSEAYANDEIDELDYQAGLLVIEALGMSATISHVVALDPSNGILPKSIQQISETGPYRKLRFDPVDEWLMRQFPSFNARGSEDVKKAEVENESFNRLADALLAVTGAKNAQDSVQEQLAEMQRKLDESEAKLAAFSESLEVKSCAGVTSAGKPCQAIPIAGAEYCWNHTSQAAPTVTGD